MRLHKSKKKKKKKLGLVFSDYFSFFFFFFKFYVSTICIYIIILIIIGLTLFRIMWDINVTWYRSATRCYNHFLNYKVICFTWNAFKICIPSNRGYRHNRRTNERRRWKILISTKRSTLLLTIRAFINNRPSTVWIKRRPIVVVIFTLVHVQRPIGFSHCLTSRNAKGEKRERKTYYKVKR